MIIYLYLKTHNVTGLKYLGKTTQNPFVYKGSGLHWTRHLKKHGNNVTTEILKECSNNSEIKHWGEYYSILWNVVASSNFANLKTESGDGGAVGPDGAKKISQKIREIRTNPTWRATVGEEAFAKMMATRNTSEWQNTIGISASKKHSATINDPSWLSTTGKEKAEKVSEKAKKRKNDPAWRETTGVVARNKEIETKSNSEWISSIGIRMKKAMSEKRNSDEYKAKHYKTCPHCNKTTDPGNYSQRHGDKCKMKGNNV